MNKILLKLEHITKNYFLGETEVPVLRGIDFTIAAGEYIALSGPSGSGKSTLMHIVGCLDKPTSGNYYLNDHNVAQLSMIKLAKVRNFNIGFVFQNFHLLAHLTALDNVALPLFYRDVSLKERRVAARQILTEVGLADGVHHYPNELSGGQRQRVAIARALVTQADIILADEPTGNLDSKSGGEVTALLESLVAKGKTVILVTHDQQLARRTQRVIQLRDGVIEVGK